VDHLSGNLSRGTSLKDTPGYAAMTTQLVRLVPFLYPAKHQRLVDTATIYIGAEYRLA